MANPREIWFWVLRTETKAPHPNRKTDSERERDTYAGRRTLRTGVATPHARLCQLERVPHDSGLATTTTTVERERGGGGGGSEKKEREREREQERERERMRKIDREITKSSSDRHQHPVTL